MNKFRTNKQRLSSIGKSSDFRIFHIYNLYRKRLVRKMVENDKICFLKNIHFIDMIRRKAIVAWRYGGCVAARRDRFFF